MTRFMDVFAFAMQSAVLLVLTLICGILPAATVPNGEWFVIIAALIYAGFMAFTWAVLSALMLESFRRRNLIATIFGIIGFAAAIFVPAITIVEVRDRAAHERALSLEVRRVMLAHFDEIDTDGDGIIIEGELVMRDWANTDEKRIVATHSSAHFSELGHVIDRKEQTDIKCFGGDGFSTFAGCRPVTTVTLTYGIGRDDLQTYPARTLERYKHW